MVRMLLCMQGSMFPAQTEARRTMLKLGLVIALATAIGQGGQKERAWQEGMLLNPENNAYFKSVERTVDGGTSAFHAAGSSDPDAVKPSLSVKDNYVVD